MRFWNQKEILESKGKKKQLNIFLITHFKITAEIGLFFLSGFLSRPIHVTIGLVIIALIVIRHCPYTAWFKLDPSLKGK